MMDVRLTNEVRGSQSAAMDDASDCADRWSTFVGPRNFHLGLEEIRIRRSAVRHGDPKEGYSSSVGQANPEDAGVFTLD